MKNSFKITTVPDSRLKKTAKKVVSFDNDLKNQIEQMKKILNHANGVGLAACQIGFDNAVFVTEFNDPEGKSSIPFHVFINPKIVEKSADEESMDEGCLSIPRIELPVIRSSKVKISAQNLQGKKFKISAKDLLARVILHENDHLNGIIFTEKIKEEISKKFPDYKKKKIIFIGTGDFAELILRGLILFGFNICSVVTETPKPNPTLVAQTAKTFQKTLFETSNIEKITLDIEKQNPDIILLSDFGQIIPQKILDIPKIAAINIHPSLLPKHRGATPIQTAILSGDKLTGVSLIKMSAKIDEGPVLAQQETEIENFETSKDLKERLAMLSLKILKDFLPQINKDNFQTLIQNEKIASKTRKFKKEDGKIDWGKKIEEIDRQIRAFHPWPGSYTFIDNKRLIIHRAILDTGKLFLDTVQLEGKKPMSFASFLKGYKGPKPDWFRKIGNLENK